jgi:hypothetical protein
VLIRSFLILPSAHQSPCTGSLPVQSSKKTVAEKDYKSVSIECSSSTQTKHTVEVKARVILAINVSLADLLFSQVTDAKQAA